jgi:hypothetical protein
MAVAGWKTRWAGSEVPVREATGLRQNTVAAERSGIKATINRETMTGGGASNGKCQIQSFAVERVRAKRYGAVQSTEERETKDGVDGDVRNPKQRRW